MQLDPLFFLQHAFVSHKNRKSFNIVKRLSSLIIFIKKEKGENIEKKNELSYRVCIVQFVLR